ncbi:Flp pilus assembly protein CpaB [Dongia sp.]|uniref:Flp pilus assembly protein CpaB n=1 Tax=Dongia sp. TaxID=1977262 RepID=UPI0037522058
MRPIVIVLIVLALGTAAIAAFLVSQFLASQTTTAPTTQTMQAGTQNVLVAARDIVPGTVLSADDIRWEPWPETLIDDRFVVQPAQVENQAPSADPQQEFIDRIARRSIMAGEPMSREMVIKQGDSGVTAANIAPGMRGITINVTPNQGVAGLILPNDHVDLLMDVSVRELVGLNGWKDVVLKYGAETFLRDIRVVAINQKLSHDPKEGVAEPGNLVTLEVTPDQAERILIAQQVGTVSLTLRSLVPGLNDKDKSQTFTMDVRASRALSSLVALDLEQDEADMPKTAADAVKMAKERAKRRSDVKINRGGSIAVQKFGQ